jgi:hypothetical protein
MENQLTEEQIDRICANLRAIDFLRRNQDKLEKHPEMKIQIAKLKAGVKAIMDILTDEQRDKVLEIHKVQTEAIEKKLTNKQKNKK